MSWKDDATGVAGPGLDGLTSGDYVPEEGPTLRSVAMLSSTAPSLFSEHSFEKTSGGFGAVLPSKFGPRPAKSLKGTARESFGVKQEWSAVAFNTSSWDVCGKDLEMVPTDFPLERTHREIKEDASIVARRISEVLRVHSIQTEFDSKIAKAKCTTQDCVNFRIRLYAGGENGQPVVVEVQRRCGSASSFMRTCRAVLSAAEGGACEMNGQVYGKVPPFVKKPIGQMKCIENAVVAENQWIEQARSALAGVIEMIRANRSDLTLLGLENLCCLTDPTKTSPVSSLYICKDILMGNDAYDIREEILVMAERDAFLPEYDQDGTPTHVQHFRQLALRVFSNCLNLCHKDGFLDSVVKEQKWFGDSLIPSLVDELKRAETSANNAYEASSCVFSLISCSEAARKSFVDNGGLVALQAANAFGVERHELLAEETGRCLNAFRNLNFSF